VDLNSNQVNDYFSLKMCLKYSRNYCYYFFQLFAASDISGRSGNLPTPHGQQQQQQEDADGQQLDKAIDQKPLQHQQREEIGEHIKSKYQQIHYIGKMNSLFIMG
jgi:hypothetical protein